MAKVIAKHNGGIIRVGNAIGLHPGCCCQSNCCPFTFDNVPFSLNVNCGGQQTQHQGTLFFGYGMSDDGQSDVSIVCTGSELCAALGPLFVGYLISVTRYGVAACSIYGKIVLSENPNDFLGIVCENPTPGSASVNLIHCFNPTWGGSISIG